MKIQNQKQGNATTSILRNATGVYLQENVFCVSNVIKSFAQKLGGEMEGKDDDEN